MLRPFAAEGRTDLRTRVMRRVVSLTLTLQEDEEDDEEDDEQLRQIILGTGDALASLLAGFSHVAADATKQHVEKMMDHTKS